MNQAIIICLFVFFSINAAFGQDSSTHGGYFKSMYKQQASDGRLQTMDCSSYGIFKSNAGWEDEKYYVLINNIPPGSIVQVQSTLTHKIVYVKVLGTLEVDKENQGLWLRLSNATLVALGIKNVKTPLTLTWYE